MRNTLAAFFSVIIGIIHAQVCQFDSYLTHEPAIYHQQFDLGIELTNSSEIYYTTDGSDPSKKSKRFEKSIPIDTSVVIKLLYVGKNGCQSIETFTYLMKDTTKMDILSISLAPNFLFDPNTGILGIGIYNDSTNTARSNFFKDIEKPCHVEYFEKGKRVLSQKVGLKLFGGMTRKLPDKSFQLIAKDEYGDHRIRYDFFGNKDQGMPKSIVLRTSGNDFNKTRFQDVLTASLIQSLGIDYQGYKPCVLYINGKYWGIFNIREKINEFFIEKNHQIERDSINILQGRQRVEHGDNKQYLQFLSNLKRININDEKGFDFIDKNIDIKNYINYYAAQIYINNADVRGNIRFWHSPATDNKLRWIVYDTDLGYGVTLPAEHNYLTDILVQPGTQWYNPVWSGEILRYIIKNDSIKNYTINQMAFVSSYTFNHQKVLHRINEFYEIYASEMPRHVTLSKSKNNLNKWRNEVSRLKIYSWERQQFFPNHLQEFFGLGAQCKVSIHCKNPFGEIIWNGNQIPNSGSTLLTYDGHAVPIGYVSDILHTYDGYVLAGDTIRDHFFIPKGSSMNIEILTKSKKTSIHRNNLVISEISSASNRPTDPGDWIELLNTSADTIRSDGFILFSENISIPIPSFSMAPGQYVIIARDAVDFYLKYNLHPTISAPISLPNDGCRILLLDQTGALIDSLSYEKNSDNKFVSTFQRGKKNWKWNQGMGSPMKANLVVDQKSMNQWIVAVIFLLVSFVILLLTIKHLKS